MKVKLKKEKRMRQCKILSYLSQHRYSFEITAKPAQSLVFATSFLFTSNNESFLSSVYIRKPVKCLVGSFIIMHVLLDYIRM